MATTGNPIVLAGCISPKLFKNLFHLILRPLRPAADLSSENSTNMKPGYKALNLLRSSTSVYLINWSSCP